MDYVLPDKYKLTGDFLKLTEEKTKSGGIGIIMPGGKGHIPVLYAKGKCLPEAWENSIIALWAHGTLLKTQYDKKEDPPSKDAAMIMVIEDPLWSRRPGRISAGSCRRDKESLDKRP